MIKLAPAGTVETVFLEFSPELEFLFREDDKTLEDLIDFSVDVKGLIRLSGGIVNMVPEEEDNPLFVPATRWSIDPMPWNSHGTYIELELPNPVTEPAQYKLVRDAMFKELEARLVKINSRLMQKARRAACA